MNLFSQQLRVDRKCIFEFISKQNLKTFSNAKKGKLDLTNRPKVSMETFLTIFQQINKKALFIIIF